MMLSHRHVIAPAIGAHVRPVVALPARHVERAHAVGTHVAEGHWFGHDDNAFLAFQRSFLSSRIFSNLDFSSFGTKEYSRRGSN
jgi:hypothetical protein